MKNIESLNMENQREADPILKELWKKYHFIGNPPLAGSPVEERLKDTCARYMKYVLGKVEPPQTQSNTEDYFAQFRANVKKPDSEASRRELHNQIALMVLGSQRSGMDITTAEQLTDFASELTYGCSIEEANERKL